MKNPYIIAEIGINHDGRSANIKKLIYSAKRAGANAVKFQLFKAESLSDKNSKIKSTLYRKRKETLYQMWCRLEITKTQLELIKKITNKIKLDLIFSVFDEYSLNRLKNFKLKFLKIASSDITDIMMLKKINLMKNISIILSTGMSNKKEITTALSFLKKKKVILMHCVSLYPCNFDKINICRMKNLKKIFKCDVGFSDHTLGFEASLLAITMGAQVIEKHFTLDKNQDGPDHILSADENDLKIICDFSRKFQIMSGNGSITPTKTELKIKKFARKGIYLRKNIKKGKVIDMHDLDIRRPQGHLDPIMISKIVGKISKKNLKVGDSFKLNFIK